MRRKKQNGNKAAKRKRNGPDPATKPETNEAKKSRARNQAKPSLTLTPKTTRKGYEQIKREIHAFNLDTIEKGDVVHCVETVTLYRIPQTHIPPKKATSAELNKLTI